MQKNHGRPVNDQRAIWHRAVGEDWSERTFATFWKAIQALESTGDTVEALGLATRPNGSINVAKLRRLADVSVMRTAMRQRAKEADSALE